MLGNLLKELPRALGRFVAYQASRLLPTRNTNKDAAGTSRAAQKSKANTALADIGLDPAYERIVAWPAYRNVAPPPDLLADPLYQLWKSTPGGHKWPQYFAAYEAVFGPIRTKPLRIMEIGVFHGSSLRMWKQYFTHPDTVIVGIDIDPTCIQFDAPARNVRVRLGSQTDGQFLRSVVEEFGPFDLIIDDGSHHSSHIITSFNHLFADALKDTGIYLVEDLHANYWPGWRDSQKSFLDICKELMEHMHAHYSQAPSEAFLGGDPRDQPFEWLDVPLIATMIQEIRIFDSIVAIYKTRREFVPYYLYSG